MILRDTVFVSLIYDANMGDKIRIYHNEICSKSNAAIRFLQERGIPFDLRLYAVDPLSVAELETLLAKLNMKPSELVRRNEPRYKAEYEGKAVSDEEWLHILAGEPELIERPIVERGEKAIVARPAERIVELI